MLLYNKDFVLVGMSASALKLLGFPSLNSFHSLYNDISELFIDEDGNHIHSDTSYLETIIQTKKPIKAFIDSPNDKIIEVEISLDDFYSKDENMYIASVNHIGSSASIKRKSLLDTDKTGRENSLPISNIFEKTFKTETKSIKETKADKDEISVQWLEYTAKKLSLSVEDFTQQLKQLSEQMSQKDELLFESLIIGDKKRVSQIISNIRSKAYSLDIKPLIKVIYRLENSENNEVSANFREYKDIITKINKLTERKNA